MTSADGDVQLNLCAETTHRKGTVELLLHHQLICGVYSVLLYAYRQYLRFSYTNILKLNRNRARG